MTPKNVFLIASTLLICVALSRANPEDANRPIIVSNKGAMIIGPAPDKNITFRLSPDATLLVNDIDVLAEIKQALKIETTEDLQVPFSAESLTEQLSQLKTDINRLTRRLSMTQSRARVGGPRGRQLRRDLNTLARLTGQLTAIETTLAKDECETDPCKNGGTCYDGYNSFQCDCATGWEGETCEKDFNECLFYAGTNLYGCLNNGECVNTPGSFRCICKNGYTGTHCRLRKNVCVSENAAELCGHGTCIPANNNQSYVCHCDQGWSKENALGPCTLDNDECEPSKNPCYGECINLPGSFKCGSCPVGYTGDGRHCVDLNECDVNNGGCSLQPKVRCINTEGSYHCGRCPPGWFGDGHTCEQTPSNSCDDQNICHPSAKCMYISDTVVCTCPFGMFGHGYGADGCSVDATIDPCENHKCQNNATCVVNGRGTSCICQQGYMGPLCAQPDACQGSPCKNGGTCQLLPGNKYKCVCPRTYTGVNCENQRSYCGALLRRELGTLRFPPVGSAYGPDERCAFIISTTASKILNVTFNDFNLEASPECNKDFLQIHDGNSLTARLVGRFCGQTLPKGDGNIISTHQKLFFWFRSDNATQARGFNISWISQPHICGNRSKLDSSGSGVIRSPGYPGKTPPNRDCEWQFEAPFGYRFLLNFYEVTLGQDENCNKDTLTIKEVDRVLLRACISVDAQPLHSSSNHITILYHTDAYREDSAFQLHYEVVPGVPGCGGVYTEPQGAVSGFIRAPICEYLIQQPNGTRIQLEFSKMELLLSPNCGLQKVIVYDGRTNEAPVLKRLCGHMSPEPIISSSNALLILYEFSLPELEMTNSFEFRYQRSCSEDFTFRDSNGLGGIITTPNYPNAYAEYMTCVFNILGPQHHVIRLNITDLSISETVPNMADDDVDDKAAISTNIEGTYLDVYLDEDVMRRYYRSMNSIELVTFKNRAKLVFNGDSNRNKKRGLRVEYSFERIGCGGVVSDGSNILGDSFNETFCEWIIEAPEGKRIEYSAFLLSADTEGSVTIYDNSTLKTLKLNKLMQGDYVNGSVDSNLLTLIFMGSHPATKTFRFTYKILERKTKCGGIFNMDVGYIQTPDWPRRYGPDQDCIWIIKAPLGKRIELSVYNFSLETTSDSCPDDYIEIRNGDTPLSPLIGKFCGLIIPPRIPSFGNRMYVAFHSDSYIEDDGFFMVWHQTLTGCGGKLTTHIGSIHSPHNNLESSSGAVACDWQIIIAQGSTIDLDVYVAEGNLCNGKLIIYDGGHVQSPQFKMDCSNQKTSLKLHSTGNQVLVRYAISEDEEDTGLEIPFSIDYVTNCNVVVDRLKGVIETPNFPLQYPPNMQCSWDLRGGGRNNKISLAFSHLSIENMSPTNCDYDYVEVLDMMNDLTLSQRRLCTNAIDPITSEGNRLVIRFVSDPSIHEQGFRAEYKRLGCGEHFENTFGHFESPNAPYSVDMDCDWYIEAPIGKQIFLKFRDLHIETENQDCSKDVLLVTEEKNSSVVLLKTCQVAQERQFLTSPGNSLYVSYRASDTRIRKFFRASYSFKDATCGGWERSNTGLITSPKYYSGIYATNMECLWSIEVPDQYGILLHFETFNLTESSDCKNTFIELSKTTDENKDLFLEKACGTQPPLTRKVHGNKMKLKFKANATGWGRFAMRYEKQCGAVLFDPNGVLKSRLDEDCSWLIEGSEGSKISLNILHLECSRKINSSDTNGLRLYDQNSNVLLFDMCMQHQTNIIIPTESLGLVADRINFRASYSSIINFCGGKITSMRGTLASPYYPDSYPSNVECVWTLEATTGNAIELNFEALNIAKSPHCNEDFLELRLGEETGQVLGLYCSNDEMPTKPLLAGERVWIKFRSVPGSTGDGFKLSWDYVHEHEVNDASGIIVSPPVLIARTQEESYSWRIVVHRGEFVELDFKEYNNGLKLYDGYDETALPIDIQYSPWTFTTSSNVVYLKTVNDALEEFKVKWRTVTTSATDLNATSNGCQEEIILSSMGTKRITSPGYPNGYAPDLYCSWTIKAEDPTQHIVLFLYDADLESIEGCVSDFLLISTSSNLQNWQEELRICDKRQRFEQRHAPARSAEINTLDNRYVNLKELAKVHGTPFMKVEFSSDSSVNGTGFKAVARAVCGSNLTGSVGTILDSHIVESRSINMTCLWHIDVHPGRQIDITVDYDEGFALKQHETCPSYGLIYDGLDEHAPLIEPGKFCNKVGSNPRTFRSKTNHIVVKYFVPSYFSNPKTNHWNLTYREYSECDLQIMLTDLARSANISSPNYPYTPHPHTDCSWTVIAPAGETITTDFVDFDMNQHYCNKEFIELYDGSTNLARQILHTCRKVERQRTTGNLLYVRYLTDTSEPRTGFKMNVSISTCGAVYDYSSSVVTSEHYPVLGAYPKPTVCEYNIKLPQTVRLRIKITDLHLPYDPKEKDNNDRIEFISLNDMATIATYYGNETGLPPPFDLASNEILIRFTSVKLTNSYRGFRLQYERLYGLCVRDISGEGGNITATPGERFSMHSLCRWRITVPKGQRVSLKFLDLQPIALLNSTNTNQQPLDQQPQMSLLRDRNLLRRRPPLFGNMRSPNDPVFTFYNDETASSMITHFELSNYNVSSVIKSTDNFMLVKIEFGLLYDSLGTITAEYNSLEDSPCPSEIGDSQTGFIDTISLQGINNFFCSVRFNAKRGETISFEIIKHTIWRKFSTGSVSFRDMELVIPFMTLNENITNGVVSLSPLKGKIVLLQSANTKLLSFQTRYRRYPCGGHLKLEEGLTFGAPNAEKHDNGLLECVWTLVSTYNDMGYALSGNISFENSCQHEYILLYSGIRAYAREPLRICRDEPLLNQTFIDKIHTTVVYHVDNYKPGQSNFTLTASKSLGSGGGIIKVSLVKRTITIDSKNYKNNMEVGWEFIANPGLYLRLSFVGRFFIEDAPNCTHDWLEVQRKSDNDIWEPDSLFCGRTLPSPRNISNHIRIIFRTNEAITGDGFTFVVESTCDMVFNATDTLQTISSPLLSMGRSGKHQCSYTFETTTSELIMVRVKNRIATHCSYTSFEVYKQQYGQSEEEFVDKYCDNFETFAYDHLRLSFQTFITQSYLIEYQLNNCGGNYSVPFQLVSKQGSEPNTYDTNMDCTWQITAPAEHAIVIRFKYFDMETSPTCNLDFLAIYKGPIESKEQLLNKICGNMTETPPQFVIDNNQAVVVAKSDDSNGVKGFLASVHFTPNCNERIALSEGNAHVTLQRQFKFNRSEEILCYYRITAPANHRVIVELKELHLNSNDGPCKKLNRTQNCEQQCNYLEILDSSITKGESMGKFCTDGRSHIQRVSSFEDVTVKFNANEPGEYNFEINVQMKATTCGQTEFDLKEHQSIAIAVPDRNLTKYEPQIHCSWHFKVATEIEIDFKRVQLPDVSQVTGKCVDYILVEEPYNARYFCGTFNNTQALVYFSYTEDDIVITLHTENVVEEEGGFELRLSAANNCNRTFTELSRRINIPMEDSRCFYEIRLPEEYSINIFTTRIYFLGLVNPYFKITDISTNETIFNTTDSYYIDKNLLTKSSALLIESNALLTSSLFYTSSNKSLPNGCGGKIFATEGVFTNPLYDNNDRTFMECTWDVSVPPGNQLYLIFAYFNMGSEVNCNLDNMKIYAVHSDGSERLENTYCGQETPSALRLRTNRALVVVKKSPNFDGDGFKITFLMEGSYQYWSQAKRPHEFN